MGVQRHVRSVTCATFVPCEGKRSGQMAPEQSWAQCRKDLMRARSAPSAEWRLNLAEDCCTRPWLFAPKLFGGTPGPLCVLPDYSGATVKHSAARAVPPFCRVAVDGSEVVREVSRRSWARGRAISPRFVIYLFIFSGGGGGTRTYLCTWKTFASVARARCAWGSP